MNLTALSDVRRAEGAATDFGLCAEPDSGSAATQMSPGPKPRSIHFWLSVLVVSIILPAWAVAALLIDRSFARQRSTLLQSTLVTAHAVMQSVDTELDSIKATLQALATSRTLLRGEVGEFQRQTQELLNSLNIMNIVLFDPSGEQIFTTLDSLDRKPTSPDNSDIFPRLFTTGKPVVSGIFLGPASGKLTVSVAVPVFNGGDLSFGLGADILPERLMAVLQRQNLPPGWFVEIYDDAGKIVARSDQSYIGKSGSADVLGGIAAAPEGWLETENVENLKTFVVFSRSPMTGWSAAISIPSAGLTADLRRSVWFSVAVAAALLLLGMLAARATSHRIARAIRALSGPGLALMAGVPSSIPPVDIAEAAEVLNALETARCAVARSAEDREKAVVAEHQTAIADRVAARFRTLLKAAPDAMIVVREDGRISIANDQAGLVFGYTTADLIGLFIDQLIPERFWEHHHHHISGFFKAPTSRMMANNTPLLACRKDGTEFPVEVSLSPTDFDGEEHVIAAIRDITERKQLEARVEESRLKMIASARLSALGGMAGGIAHEINNPLAVIHALASDLEERAEAGEPSTQDVLRSTQRIVGYADRIGKIVTSLRYLARDGTHDPLSEASVRQMIDQALELSVERFRQHSVALLTEPVDPTLRIACREVQICQILTNLLHNAFDAVQEQAGEKWIRVLVTTEEDHVTISIIDSGPGVPPELRARIMEPFFTTKPVGKGTGLGLSLSKQIAAEHGGSLTSGEYSGHTCFALSLQMNGHRSAACS